MNRKHVLSALCLCLLLAVCCLFGLAEEASNAESCTHSFANRVVNDSTCSSLGTQESYCTSCGTVSGSSSIPMKKHSNEIKYLSYATCQKPDTYRYECVNCDYASEVMQTSTRDHSFNRLVTVKEATCTSPGVYNRYCDWCDQYTEVRSNALGHTEPKYSSTSATCTKNGITTGKCTRCDSLLSSKITENALSHQMGTKHYVYHFNCTLDRDWTIKCDRCWIVLRKGTDKAPGHILGNEITKSVDAKCTQDGFTTKTCTVCNEDVLTSTTPATGHLNTKWTIWSYLSCKGEPETWINRCTDCGAELERKTTASSSSGVAHNAVKRGLIDKDGRKYDICSDCGTTWYNSPPPVATTNPTPGVKPSETPGATPSVKPSATPDVKPSAAPGTPMPTPVYSTDGTPKPTAVKNDPQQEDFDPEITMADITTIQQLNLLFSQKGIVFTSNVIESVFLDNAFLDICFSITDDADNQATTVPFTEDIIHTDNESHLNITLINAAIQNVEAVFSVGSMQKLSEMGITSITIHTDDDLLVVNTQAMLDAIAFTSLLELSLDAKIIFTVSDETISMSVSDELGHALLERTYPKPI